MIKKLLIISLISFSRLIAHDEYFLEIIDNKNNTITIIGDDDHKKGIAGAMIRLESLISGNILYKERFSESSKLTVIIPKEPYQVILDAGGADITVKEGIAPLEGFSNKMKIKANEVVEKLSKAEHHEDEWNLVIIFFFSLCLILFGLAIYFSNKNTNKILNRLKENK